jgi:hypothetical protein
MNTVCMVMSFVFGIGIGGLATILIVCKKEGWFK